MRHRCPVCKKIVKPPDKKQKGREKHFPFCSQRCKLIDLGAWLDAEYKIISKLKTQQTNGPPDISDNTTTDEQ